jgi:hypothetical protein
MALSITQAGMLLEHVAGGAGDDICPYITGMRDRGPYTLEEGMCFGRIVCKSGGNSLRYRDAGLTSESRSDVRARPLPHLPASSHIMGNTKTRQRPLTPPHAVCTLPLTHEETASWWRCADATRDHGSLCEPVRLLHGLYQWIDTPLDKEGSPCNTAMGRASLS